MTTKTKTIIKTMYWLPHCSTCQKADAFLRANGADIQNYFDVKTQAITIKDVKALAEAVGGPEALFSKRAMKYRSLGLDKQNLTPEQMLDWMVKEYTFIKRPVIVTENGQVLAGFSEKQYKILLGLL